MPEHLLLFAVALHEPVVQIVELHGRVVLAAGDQLSGKVGLGLIARDEVLHQEFFQNGRREQARRAQKRHDEREQSAVQRCAYINGVRQIADRRRDDLGQDVRVIGGHLARIAPEDRLIARGAERAVRRGIVDKAAVERLAIALLRIAKTPLHICLFERRERERRQCADGHQKHGAETRAPVAGLNLRQRVGCKGGRADAQRNHRHADQGVPDCDALQRRISMFHSFHTPISIFIMITHCHLWVNSHFSRAILFFSTYS